MFFCSQSLKWGNTKSVNTPTHTHGTRARGGGLNQKFIPTILFLMAKQKRKKKKERNVILVVNLCFVPSFYLFLQEFLYFLFSQSLSSEHPPCVYRTLLPAVCVCVCVQKDQQNISALSGGRGKNHRASTRHWFTHKYVRNFCFSKTHPSLIGWSDLLGSDCCWGFVDWTDRSRALHCVIKKKRKKKEDTDSLPNELSG